MTSMNLVLDIEFSVGARRVLATPEGTRRIIVYMADFKVTELEGDIDFDSLAYWDVTSLGRVHRVWLLA